MTRLEKLNNFSKDCETEINTYSCTECKDLKFIFNEEGEAKVCKCKIIQDTQERIAKSEIGVAFKEKTFKNYDYTLSSECTDAMATALKFCQNFDTEQKSNSIIFCGNSGLGKTHLSVAIANNLIEKGVGILYMPYREVITKLKQSITDEQTYKKTINKYKLSKCLIIDDLFKGKITESDINIVFELINYRYLNKLPVIISSEMMPKQLLGVDEAIGSRILEMSKEYIVEFKEKGKNYRL